MSPIVFGNHKEVLPGANPTVSQWQRLASMDRQSANFSPLLSSLISQDDRSSKMKLCRADAKVTLDIMDQASSTFSLKTTAYVAPSTQVLRDCKVPKEHMCDTIYAMRKLAYSSGEVPARYQIDPQSLSVETALIACGAFADVRKGRLGHRVVAVRTPRVDQKTDENELKKVCVISKRLFGLTDDPRNLALLQGVYHMDEPFSSKHIKAHWCRYQPSNRPVFNDIRVDGEWKHQGLPPPQCGQ